MLRAKGALGFLNTLWAKPKSIASGRKKVTLLLIYVFLIRSKTNWEKLNPPDFQGEP